MSSSTRVPDSSHTPVSTGVANSGTEYAFPMIAKVVTALLRLALGFTFLWAFFDKLFGLGYSTPSARAWINGGNPTKGFLGSIDVGPFQDFYHSIAGAGWANVLFMLGLFAIGAALMVGAGMKIAAWSGALMMLMMWAAEWPMATLTSVGEASGSTNPFVDYHIIYALAGLVLAYIGAGFYYGAGGWWTKVIGSKTWLQ